MKNNSKPKQPIASSPHSKVGVKSTPPPIPTAPSSVSPNSPPTIPNNHSKPLLAIAVTATVVAAAAVTLLLATLYRDTEPTRPIGRVVIADATEDEKTPAAMANTPEAMSDRPGKDTRRPLPPSNYSAPNNAPPHASTNKPSNIRFEIPATETNNTKQLTSDDVVSTKLPNEDDFGSHYKSEQPIATINQAIQLPVKVDAIDNGIQFVQAQQNIWTIEDADGNYGTLTIEADKDQSTSTLKLVITSSFKRASPETKHAIRSGFKLNGIDVRVTAEPLPPLIYALASPTFKSRRLNFVGASPVHPVFTPVSASSLERELNMIVKDDDETEVIELVCQCSSDERISILGFEGHDPILLEIRMRSDGVFEMGLEGDKSLAAVINDALLRETHFLSDLLNKLESASNGKRAETQARLQSARASNALTNSNFRGIVLPIASKNSPPKSARYYVVFGNTLNDEATEQAIKNWESGASPKVSP